MTEEEFREAEKLWLTLQRRYFAEGEPVMYIAAALKKARNEVRNEAIDEMCEAAIQETDGEIQRRIATQLGLDTVEMKEIGRIRAAAARLKERNHD